MICARSLWLQNVMIIMNIFISQSGLRFFFLHRDIVYLDVTELIHVPPNSILPPFLAEGKTSVQLARSSVAKVRADMHARTHAQT